MATNRLPYVQRHKLRNGQIRFRAYAPDGDGRRVYSETFATEHEAYEKALAMRGEARNRSDSESLYEAREKLLDELRAKRTAGTVRWYSDHLRAVEALIPGETLLCKITRETVEQFVLDRLRGDKRKVKPATVNADLRALHRVFAHAIRRGIVSSNPVRQVDRPRADAPAMDWFTTEEFVAAVLRVADPVARDLLTLFAMTGIRRSEAARLEPGHVRLRLGQLVVPGKNATRVVPLSADVVAPLERILARAHGGKLIVGGVHAIDDVFRAAREACGDRRMHPHALRHTFGTALIRAGTRPDVVMRLMGHRSITTTLRYVHEVGEDGVKAVGQLRLVPPAESARAAPQ